MVSQSTRSCRPKNYFLYCAVLSDKHLNTVLDIERPMDNKVALVTGSTAGIGLGIAHRLGGAGYDVILTGHRGADVMKDTLSKLRQSYKGKFTYVPADLSNGESTLDLCKKVLCLYPDGVDILVNNAGINQLGLVEEYPLDKFNELIAVNVTAPFIIIKHFIPCMKKKGWGRIINTASQMGLVSAPLKVPYSTTKAGLIGMTKGVALEVAEHGITCNAICPGYVETDIHIKQIEKLAADGSITVEEMKKTYFTDKHPTKKPVTIEEVSGLVGFLCSDEAASIAGTTLSIDGGYSAQ